MYLETSLDRKDIILAPLITFTVVLLCPRVMFLTHITIVTTTMIVNIAV